MFAKVVNTCLRSLISIRKLKESLNPWYSMDVSVIHTATFAFSHVGKLEVRFTHLYLYRPFSGPGRALGRVYVSV